MTTKTVYLAVEMPETADETAYQRLVKLLTENDSWVVRQMEDTLKRLVGEDADLMVEPMRDGVILKVAHAQRALSALEGLDSLPADYMPSLPEDHEAREAIEACLEVIARAGA